MAVSLRLLLVDDHDYVLTSLAAGLEAYEDVNVVGTTSSSQDVVALCFQLNPTIVVTDLIMEGEEQGLTIIHKIRQSHPSIPVIMLTAYADEQNRERALAAGAADFLDKTDLTLDHLVTVMHKVVETGQDK